MTIIKNGREKKYYASCAECASEIEYEYSDVCTEKSAIPGSPQTRTIKCPVCGTIIPVNLRTKEELDKISNSLFGYNSFRG